MDEHGARDLNAEADAWRAAGWTGPYSNPHPYPSDSSITSHVPTETVNTEDVRSGDMWRSEVPPAITESSNARSYGYQRPAASGEPYQNPVTPSGTRTTTSSSSNQFPVRRGPVHISDDDPAYIFGNRWASDPNYNGRSWTDVESSLRSNWEATGSGPWIRSAIACAAVLRVVPKTRLQRARPKTNPASADFNPCSPDRRAHGPAAIRSR